MRNRLIVLVESRIRREVYVRFGGEYPETYHSNMARRWVLSLLGKKPIDWLRLPSTIGFLKDLSEVRKSHFGVIEIVRGGDTGGGVTWMNRNVAIEFSRWLSNKFGIWCNDKILELLDKGTVSLNEQEKMLFGKKTRSWKIK